AASSKAASGDCVCSPISGLRGGNGSVLRRASSGASARGPGARGPIDVAGVCSPLRQGAEERRPRRRGDCRGIASSNDAFCPVEKRGTVRPAIASSCGSGLITERTALINHLRTVLLERGIIIAQGRRKLEKALPEILAKCGVGHEPSHSAPDRRSPRGM